MKRDNTQNIENDPGNKITDIGYQFDTSSSFLFTFIHVLQPVHYRMHFDPYPNEVFRMQPAIIKEKGQVLNP